MENDLLNKEVILKVVLNALLEDIGGGDITTNSIIPHESKVKAFLLAKEPGIIAGLNVAETVFTTLDEKIVFTKKVNDGSRVDAKTVIAEMEGSYRAILTGERTALNFLQRMSGIATQTAKFVEAVSGTKTKILDTRKTAPGLRLLDKYAVKCGGGTNHRIGLYDLVMIKDNHIKVAGSITKAVDQVLKTLPKGIKIEVETSNLDEVKEALQTKADIIMLDNMSTEMMKEAVDIINGKMLVEASGNMSIERIKETAQTGVDFISVGALTHSVKALDIGQYIKN